MIHMVLLLGLCQDAELISYFIDNKTEKCWVLDRDSNRGVVSVAATGYGFCAWAILARRGVLPKQEVISWINRGIDATLEVNKKNRGWLYHFTDRDGVPVYNKEVSTVDTAIFYWGARKAAEILEDEKLKARVECLIDAIDLDFMMQGEFFYQGLIWDGDRPAFFLCQWKEFSEGHMIYRLFDLPYQPTVIPKNLSLFCYYYPLGFYKDEQILGYLKDAVKYQKETFGQIGHTACDGPEGYRVMEVDVVSPLAVWSIDPFFPKECEEFFETFHVDKNLPSLHLKRGWKSRDRIGIDVGACLLTHTR